MKKYILFAGHLPAVLAGKSQDKPAITDSCTFYLHKFAQHIGKEIAISYARLNLKEKALLISLNIN